MKQAAPLRMNILVVDDEAPVARSISSVLRLHGHAVEIINDGAAALEIIAGSPGKFQVLITDHSMEGMTGLEMLHRLRKTDFRGKIIVLSGWLTHELENAYKKLLVDRIMSKPFDIFELRAAVDNLGAGTAENC